MAHPEVERLVEVMAALRACCPWDARQTHRSLVTHLVEEAAEVVEAIESGTDADLVEELGDLLLQVVFHAEIARGQGRFDIDDIARGIADKLVARHPYVFDGSPVPDDLKGSWEARKRSEKGRTSALDGIPPLDALARTMKVVARARSHGVDPGLPTRPVTASEVGEQVVDLVARAQASGVDADQAVRDRVRELEAAIRAAEAASRD